MIKYLLRCGENHEFEGWFRSSADYDAQAGDGLLACPACGADTVEKAIMAPAVARRDGGERLSGARRSIVEAAARARDYVEKNFDYVGDRFPDEARRIHYGESDKRAIFGEASPAEAKALVEEGVEIAPLPAAPAKPAPDRAGPPRPAAAAAPAKPANKRLN